MSIAKGQPPGRLHSAVLEKSLEENSSLHNKSQSMVETTVGIGDPSKKDEAHSVKGTPVSGEDSSKGSPVVRSSLSRERRGKGLGGRSTKTWPTQVINRALS